MPDAPQTSRSASLVPRVLVAGAVGTVLLLLAGTAGLVWRLGTDVEATATRIERDVRGRFARHAEQLARAVDDLRSQPAVVPALVAARRDPRILFDALDTVARTSGPDVALSIAGSDGTAIAWAGRPQALPLVPQDRGPALVLAPGALGLRLVYVEPLRSASGGSSGPVIGILAAEQHLSGSTSADARGALEAQLETSLLPVVLRPRFLGDASPNGDARVITLQAPTGEPLADVVVPYDTLHGLRRTWWRRLAGIGGLCLGTTALVLAGVLAWERRWLAPRAYRRFTLLALASLLVARLLWWFGWAPLQDLAPRWSDTVYQGDWLGWLHRTPLDLCLTASLLLAIVMLAVDPLRRVRLALRRVRRRPTGPMPRRLRFVGAQLLAGLALAALLGLLARLVQDTVDHTELDVLMLALLPPIEPRRLLVLLGLLGLGASTFWGGVLALRIGLIRWRLATLGPWRRLGWPLLLWIAPLAVALALLRWRGAEPPVFALLGMALCAGVAALASGRGMAWFRRGTQARRLLWAYGALLLPALLLYPLLLHAIGHARRSVIATQYAPQVLSHRRVLGEDLTRALAQIDDVRGLPNRIAAVPREPGRVPTDTAFGLWQQTDLAARGLTSAVEIYAPDGPQVSRFGFNFPEYEATEPPQWRSEACTWTVFAEAGLFGSEERSMYHAERAVCERDAAGQTRVRGGIIVHVMLDYSSLPFLSTQGPYYDLLRGAATAPRGAPSRGIDLIVYGWGRTPTYSSAERVWELPTTIFERAYTTRDPFWATQTRGSRVHDLYVSNDRTGIYVVSVPRVTPVEHLVHVAEVATLAALALLLVLGVHAVLHRVNRRGPQPATLLVREVRASFTRKLFLAFVATSVIPVLTLAFVVRTFVASRLRADVEAEATRTAAVAQRVIEEALALQQPALVTATTLTDDVMVWMSRVIKQDVNIFDGPTLLATSQRDLFAQGLLPERTPDSVYRAIMLQRLPTFVGEDQIGPLKYQLAATPIRIGSREGILTVPMTLRQREIEREIAELDRSVNLGAVVFILLGAALGYSISGRIGDPVQRLTRASRRIAAGDLDQHVVARTADELQGLVEAFNSMAAELSRQRVQLQRTNRLEAWAEMARQVAHDIKNPLTPIQLSAEHLRRVHLDRGTPLSPVLEQCVDTILVQVRMLRQISSEFASFASSPTARPEPVSLTALVEEVLAGYRIGLPSNVVVQGDVPADLPPVLIDRALLGRAMINIIENALHAMPSGGAVTIGATRHNADWVRVSLTDTGVGMDAAALARLFEPYFSTKAAGTGLGLTIARRNVELMGGRIDVQSRKGVGTTVSLDVPVATTAGDGGPAST